MSQETQHFGQPFSETETREDPFIATCGDSVLAGEPL